MIDLVKIIAEKRHIENEPVLLRDILPTVMTDIRKRYKIEFRRQLIPGQGERRQQRSRVIAGSSAAG